MTASETAGSCIAAAVGILLLTPAAFDIWHKRRTRRRFQTTARQAARHTEADVQRDLAAVRAKRTRTERREFDRIIAAEYPKTLPTQRQPRKDQP